jgi:hypothetical protein
MPPPLRAEVHPTLPVGHARIVLRGIGAGADLGFCLLREGYAAGHLGPRGWQVSEAVLAPAAVEEQGADAVLVLSPALVRHVEPGPMTLRLPALGRDLALFWPADIPVYDEGDDALALATAAPKPAPQPATRKQEREPIAVAPAPVPLAPRPPPPIDNTRRPWLLVALAVLVIAGGAAAWWFGLREEPAPAPTPEPVATLPAQGTPAPPPLPPAWPEGTDALTPAEAVARAPDAPGILAVALRRQAAGRHDDALVLFEEAADRGVAAALTALGRLYDPIGFRPGQPFSSPDMRQAADYYRRAATAGDTQVLALREALKAYLEQGAAAGNATAAEALREFWP